ncbi:MAG: DinB family protein [Chloroflexota bacterium]
MIRNTEQFISYFGSIRRRTLNYARVVPDSHINWAPEEGEFTCADILRHIASAEKMFVHVVTHGKWYYGGHNDDKQQTLESLLKLLDETHSEAMLALSTVSDEELDQYRPAFEGETQVKVWRWLMAMAEHEIHHRSQLAMYLRLMEITPPHIYGLGVEDLIARSTQ